MPGLMDRGDGRGEPNGDSLFVDVADGVRCMGIDGSDWEVVTPPSAAGGGKLFSRSRLMSASAPCCANITLRSLGKR